MKKLNLISKYSMRKYRKLKIKVNKDEIPNVLARNFKNRKLMEVVVSDLTYVDISGKWNYICILLELSSREIIGFSASKNKDANLVEKAFYSVKYNLFDIEIFHTDRGSEFKNATIEKTVETFKIKSSLSRAGNPYDNAVSESLYNIIKTEFIKGNTFKNLETLETMLFDYVNWYNNFRIHSSLNYKTPMEFKCHLQNALS